MIFELKGCEEQMDKGDWLKVVSGERSIGMRQWKKISWWENDRESCCCRCWEKKFVFEVE